MEVVRYRPQRVVPIWRWGFWSFSLGACLVLAPFRLVQVTGISMEPTLHDGQRLLVDRWYYRMTGLYRNDLVVMRHDGETWIKRLVGVAGDRIALVYGPEGTIDGVMNLQSGLAIPPGARVVTIPPGYLFILGDNMEISKDSRIVGPLAITELFGVVRSPTMGRYFPPPSHR